jgi:hypothetical protein
MQIKMKHDFIADRHRGRQPLGFDSMYIYQPSYPISAQLGAVQLALMHETIRL